MIKACTYSSDYQLPWQKHPIAMRVYSAMAHKPYCGEGKVAYLIRGKKQAVQYPYIVLNPPTQIYWLTFDLDHSDMLIWQSVNLPCPNFIVRDPHTGKGHITYALESVCISPKARTAPMRYLAAIKRTMTRLLKADTAYNNRVTKNPFHPHWKTTWLHHNLFALGDLHEYLPTLDQASYNNLEGDDWVDTECRNHSVFNQTRFWAYKAVGLFRNNSNFKTWSASVLQKTQAYARQAQCPKRGCLSENEVAGIARSIAKWCWHHYQGSKSQEGKLKLDKTLPLKERQRLGAQYTHQQRRQKTVKKIQQAVAQLRVQGKKVTQVAVAKLTGLCRQQIANNYANLLKADHQESVQAQTSTPQLTVSQTAEFTPSTTSNKEQPHHDKANVKLVPHQVTALLNSLLKNNYNERHDGSDKNKRLREEVEQCSASEVKNVQVRSNKNSKDQARSIQNTITKIENNAKKQRDQAKAHTQSPSSQNSPQKPIASDSANRPTQARDQQESIVEAIQKPFERLTRSGIDLSKLKPEHQAQLIQVLVESGWSEEQCVAFSVKMVKQIFTRDLPADIGFLETYVQSCVALYQSSE